VKAPYVGTIYEDDNYDLLYQYLWDQRTPVTLQEIEVNADVYSKVPPFFLQGGRGIIGPDHPAKKLRSMGKRWGTAKVLFPGGLEVWTVYSPSHIFLFSHELAKYSVDSPEIFYQLMTLVQEDYEYLEAMGMIEQEWDEEEDMVENPGIWNWVMWGAYTANMLMNPPWVFQDETVGYHHGQRDGRLWVFGPDVPEALGYIDYSEFPSGSGEVYVNWTYVEPKHRRKGIGTALVNEISSNYKVYWGFTTIEGEALLEKALA